MSELTNIGWREWLALPDLAVPMIKTKIDSGAKTSVLHTYNQEVFKQNRKERVRFWVHPIQRNTSKIIRCEADVWDHRLVSDSGGHKEHRFFIKTSVCLGTDIFSIELSLTNRDLMRFRMLLGREALKNRYLIDTSRSYLMEKPVIKTFRR